MLKKILALLLVLLLATGCALAEANEIKITEVSTEIGGHYVRYPQLEGMQNAEWQSRINDQIVLLSGVSNHLVTLITLGQNPWNLKVDHQSQILDGRIFSTVISAKGKIGIQRDAHAYTALAYDLQSGERITLEDLFNDVPSAVEYMEAQVQATLSDELNGYLEYSQLAPLPQDSFTLDEKGITFWYPAEQFSLLSGYAGAVQFWYDELDDFWKEPVAEKLTAKEQKRRIEQSISSGMLPKIPAEMGQPMNELTETYRLLRTPDEFPGGRYYVMEDPAFRSILIISDALETDLNRSVVEGIQLKRGALHGLKIGQTLQQEWRSVLGAPVETVAVTEGMAYDYRLQQGNYDVYHYGAYELRLHADLSGVLCAIQLCNK